ncbi:hypothetical protein [Streptomyces californicus]|uniref:hypothetical protein n=1 Tax=Streptomyces californicus TaxID=67351 RepID=UPI00296FE2DE|nr:hypothetical protein [Streptomyces californicus]MDW4912530.1 hypothetical protein [Streptomyces californicus]
MTTSGGEHTPDRLLDLAHRAHSLALDSINSANFREATAWAAVGRLRMEMYRAALATHCPDCLGRGVVAVPCTNARCAEDHGDLDNHRQHWGPCPNRMTHPWIPDPAADSAPGAPPAHQ